MKLEKFISENKYGLLIKDKTFSELTTMKVGGKIKLLYYPSNIDCLKEVLFFLNKKKRDFFIIGNGSNLVASEKKYKTLVISGKHLIKSVDFFEDYFVASAFMDLRVLIAKLLEKQISTLTNLAGIPATVGGAVVMNSSAFNLAISDNLLWVKYLEDGIMKTKNKDEIYFSYRDSEFKNTNIVLVEVAFKTICDQETVFNYKNILEKRRNKHPLNYPNCGSIFKNSKDYIAYEVIRKINMVDVAIGGAKFSEKHSNFIVNFNNAKANDIYKLIKIAKQKALKYENIDLKEEVILLNF